MLITMVESAPSLEALGGSGWVGAGLLGAVLCWLLIIRLPANDKQTRELIERHDRTVEAIVAKQTEALAAEAQRCLADRREARADHLASFERVCAPLTKAVETVGRTCETLERVIEKTERRL